jgi:fructose-bisphosphate aldolase class I
MNLEELETNANALVAHGKGILAADESHPTMARRLESIDVEATEDNRRAWRELLFTSEGIGETISGVILFDETIRQETSDGRRMVDVLQSQGVIPGIKVDKGAKPLAGADGETVTEGLDGLRDRCQEYYELGARFTKWRAPIKIGESIPSTYGLDANAHALARFAALSQEAGLVPIVEPEVLMDGDHDIDRCFEVTEAALHSLFRALVEQRVHLEGTLLKPNMVLSGTNAELRVGPEEVARQTIACLRRGVPASIPGCVFLSGGQSDAEATLNLDAINRQGSAEAWQLSFSYGRGLQGTPLKAWGGKPENVAEAQRAFQHRARVTAAARSGEYTSAMEETLARV